MLATVKPLLTGEDWMRLVHIPLLPSQKCHPIKPLLNLSHAQETCDVMNYYFVFVQFFSSVKLRRLLPRLVFASKQSCRSPKLKSLKKINIRLQKNKSTDFDSVDLPGCNLSSCRRSAKS